MKKGHKRKHKKSADNQAEYYYPGKNASEQVKESSPPKVTYSLRKRNKGLNKKYVEKSEDDFEEEEFEERNPRPAGVSKLVLAFRREEEVEGPIIKTSIRPKINGLRSMKIRNTNCRILSGILKGMNLII